MLKEDDDILLAFNSSQVAPLLPGTKQCVYTPPMHMMHNRPAAAAAATAAQQQQQQGQQGQPPQVRQTPPRAPHHHPTPTLR